MHKARVKPLRGISTCLGLLMMTAAMSTGALLPGCDGQPAGPNTDPIPGGGAWIDFKKPPAALHEYAAAVHNGKLYLVGGRVPSGGTVSSLYRYDPPPVDDWTQLASHPGTAVDHMGAAFVDGILYAMGGTTEFPGPSVSEVYAYDPAADEWSQKASMPATLGIMGVGVVDRRIYCIGGLSDFHATDFVFEYNPSDNEWTDLTSTCPMPTPRDHCPAATVNGKIHMIGGRDTTIFAITGVHEVFDPATRGWETKSSLPTPRGGFAAAVLNGKILIMGGEGADNAIGVFSENEQYDPDTNTWKALSPMKEPRHSMHAGMIGDVVYVAAGAPSLGRTFTDVHQGFSFAFE